MITRVLAVGLLAGLLAGLTSAALQAYTTTPIILEAETFEKGAAPAPAAALGGCGEARLILVHGGAEHAHGEPRSGRPADGLERTSTPAPRPSRLDRVRLDPDRRHADRRRHHRRAARLWPGRRRLCRHRACARRGPVARAAGHAGGAISSRGRHGGVTAAATAGALWLFLRAESIALRMLAVPLLLAPHIWGAPHLVRKPRAAFRPSWRRALRRPRSPCRPCCGR